MDVNRPTGVFDQEYAQDMAILRTRLQWGLFVGLLVAIFLVFPLFSNTYLLSLTNMIVITIISVLGLNILTGYTGQISLGQAAFMATGGYISAILTIRFDMPFIAALLCAGIGSALMGLVFALPAARIKGFYLAMATLAAQFTVVYIVNITPNWTGGIEGLMVPPAQLGNLLFNTDRRFYYLAMTIMLIMLYCAKNLSRTRTGRSLIAVRDNDLAATVLGINVFTAKLRAFAICSFYGGIAGSLLVHNVGFVHPDQFPLMESIWQLGMVIVGGMGAMMGAVYGTVLLELLGEGASLLAPNLSELISKVMPAGAAGLASALVLMAQSLLIILFLIFEPRGVAHRFNLVKNYYRLWPFSY